MLEILELDGDGWRRDSEPWLPTRPFYAVLGDPIAHSLSPIMQNAALMEREIETVYHAVKIQASQLRRLKDSALGEYLAGFNVTAPHKEAVAALCDGRTDQARDLGAVNTVKVEDGKWMGHNTDSGGILTVVAQKWGDGERPEKVVVLGAGGAGRAAIDAMLRWDVPHLEIRNRSAAGQAQIGAWLEQRETTSEIVITGLQAGSEDAPSTSSLWINCLAGGVASKDFLPIAGSKERSVLMDLRYGDQRPAEDAPLGFEFMDGLPVLLMQGGLSFAWWNGPPVPWSVMRDALI